MRKIKEAAPAKINLILDIVGRRPDGYHDLKTVMQTVSLSDQVRIQVGTGEGIHVRTAGMDLPDGPEHLAWRAADAFLRAVGLECPGIAIEVEKRIPAQAGMAGGSADAAAVLRGLRSLLAPRLTLAELAEIGGTLGSDVPFCVYGGAALAEGRGERLTPLPHLPDCTILLCKPPFGLSTPELFGRVRMDALSWHPDADAMVRALRDKRLTEAASMVGNVFETVLRGREADAVSLIRGVMHTHGALAAAMTGSGPTVFGLFAELSEAAGAARQLQRTFPQTFLTQPV